MALKFIANVDQASIKSIRDKIKSLERPLTKREAQSIGNKVLKKMKSLISKGISPIKGKGRFPKYKNPARYPAKLKPKTPVNLKLSGDFLKDLKARAEIEEGVMSINIGYRDADEKIKERGHREAKKQPFRPTIPQTPREKFVLSIQNIYLKEILKVFQRLIRKK